ncbi:hypothetical protein P154DRAFT_580670 [Amniculicola lignicola CBS 123094]|uniref:Uncharacterized protein n=1 Tax=Amniculicola lignicola CBS 123094 TaxID=1392246 RepID=A0A6A5W1L5_9PLEO|nr:hypothetical protein P154DRAFT_580670 [Amniculicola lignicola CBS 123094]
MNIKWDRAACSQSGESNGLGLLGRTSPEQRARAAGLHTSPPTAGSEERLLRRLRRLRARWTMRAFPHARAALLLRCSRTARVLRVSQSMNDESESALELVAGPCYEQTDSATQREAFCPRRRLSTLHHRLACSQPPFFLVCTAVPPPACPPPSPSPCEDCPPSEARVQRLPRSPGSDNGSCPPRAAGDSALTIEHTARPAAQSPPSRG